MRFTASLIASATIAAVAGPALARAAEGDDLTLANMAECQQLLKKGYSDIKETPTLICAGTDLNNGTEINRTLTFKSKRTGIQIELMQFMSSSRPLTHGIAISSDTPRRVFRWRHRLDGSNGTFQEVMGRQTVATKIADMPAPLRAAYNIARAKYMQQIAGDWAIKPR